MRCEVENSTVQGENIGFFDKIYIHRICKENSDLMPVEIQQSIEEAPMPAILMLMFHRPDCVFKYSVVRKL
jgi:hypothetical protein